MKNYNEIADSVLSRRDEYEKEQSAKRKKMIRISSFASCFVIVAVLGVGIWQGGWLDFSSLPTADSPAQEGNNNETATNNNKKQEQTTNQIIKETTTKQPIIQQTEQSQNSIVEQKDDNSQTEEHINAGSGNPSPGGYLTEGIDPIIAALAVYPNNENIQNVKNATVKNIGQNEVYEFPILGNYLPEQIPDNYNLKNASIYETTMKNGTVYHMLRATYGNSNLISTYTDDAEIKQNSNVLGDEFVIFVTNYKPTTDATIYDAKNITVTTINQTDVDVVYISFDDVYMGITNLNSNAIVTIVNSIYAKNSY